MAIILLLAACTNREAEDTIKPGVSDDANYFIWKGMNAYYFWQKDIPNLADNRFTTFSDLYTHFRGYSSQGSVFESLLKKPNDRFSWIVDDYVELENSFQGINLSNGMEFGLKRYENSAVNIYGYVRYVVPNSDADNKGVKRGMIFNGINGTQLTDTNYTGLLFSSNTNYTANFADYNAGNPSSNGGSADLNKVQIQENPIAVSKIITDGSKKIGYLLYNQFASSYDGELNAAFSTFKSSNVDELIIDLRYNGGGSVRTATYLGSMITGQFNGQLYSKEVWNEKVQAAVSADRFINNFTNEIENGSIKQTINNLNLTSVYFIVSGSTASASELVINALSPYIDVKIVGTTTVGKQVGSITLYDSENLQRTGDNLNPDHKYAIQPIVLEISNKNNQNYPEGFIPGLTLPGIKLAENYGNLGVLGERSDPLLDRTLVYISTGAKTSLKEDILEYKEIYNSKLATPSSNNMYVELKE
ncbi:MAG: S41 family peptidase [Polaribacter sp.]|uniref:S41 family peptidase n=1 Tax=Polaribacter sp. TaxID=1920175 RepID=UPI002F35D80B